MSVFAVKTIDQQTQLKVVLFRMPPPLVPTTAEGQTRLTNGLPGGALLARRIGPNTSFQEVSTF